MALKSNWAAHEIYRQTDQNDTAGQINNSTVATIAALKALTAAPASGATRVLGYASAGDGGGGVFRWDFTDTTSADNGGTILTSTGGLAGRWKRVYEGEVNARWFGVSPNSVDNTAALQAAVDWASRAYPTIGGVVFIPMGWYDFKFDAGTSGLSTITVAADNVLIRGEGKGTKLQVTNHARPSQLAYFFTFSQGARGQGGGVRDLNFYGQSMLKWCIYLNTWRDMSFENVSAFDVHSGILDADAAIVGTNGDNILVRHLDMLASADTTVSQYGVRFRAGAGSTTGTWTDSHIQDCMLYNCWDTGVVLDGVHRFSVRDVSAGSNTTTTDTIDGTSKAGCLRAVRITNSVAKSSTATTGGHIVDGIYHESLVGGEAATTHSAVWIDTPVAQAVLGGHNRDNYIYNVDCAHTSGAGLLRLVDDNGFGLTHDNTFKGNRRKADTTLITIGASVTNTYLQLAPAVGSAWTVAVSDAGTNTVINGRVAVPATATSAGNQGQWAADASNFYICTALNTWRRVAIATW
jgi:hypothetical protein